MQSCKRKCVVGVGSDSLKPHLIALIASCLYLSSQFALPATMPTSSAMSLYHNGHLSLWNDYQINVSLYKLPLAIVFYDSNIKENNTYSDKEST